MAMTDATFDRILIARQSERNGCFVDDGVPLTVRPSSDLPKKRDKRHHFVSTTDGKTRNRYGWVAAAAPLTADEFAARYLNRDFEGAEERAHVVIMLKSIAAFPIGTPVACGYDVRGVETKRVEFVVHRVVFHR